MSDSYVALIDTRATAEEASALAPLVVEFLTERRLIVPELSEACVLGGLGYPAGPGCAEAYAPAAGDELLGANRFWELRTSGVEIHCEPWVNEFGFMIFDGAVCPRCRSRRDDEFLSDVAAGVEAFTSTGAVPSVACPACANQVSLHEWECDPHLGFVNLAIVFWNWPAFDDDDWTVDVRALLEQKLQRPLIQTFGHM